MAEKFKAQLEIELVDRLSKEVDKLAANNKKQANTTEKTWKKAGRGIEGAFKKVGAAITAYVSFAAIKAGLQRSLDEAIKFQKGMAEVSTLTNMSAKEVQDQFGDIARQTQIAFGKDSQDVIKALYDGFSAGVPTTQKAAKEYLKAVGQLAVGGVTDMQAAGDAITTVTNAFKDSGITFEQASNAMFGAVRAGKTTVTELSSSIGQLATIASQGGLSIEEMFGSVAALTSVGVKTPQAMTQIRGAVKSMIAPSKSAAKAFESIGIKDIGNFMQQYKDNKFLNTIIELDTRLKKKTKTSADYNKALKEMFPEIEGMSGVMSLAANNSEKFRESIKMAARDGGQASEAFKKMQGDYLKLAQAQQRISVAFEKFGTKILPHVADAIETIVDGLTTVVNALEQNRFLSDLFTATKAGARSLFTGETMGQALAAQGALGEGLAIAPAKQAAAQRLLGEGATVTSNRANINNEFNITLPGGLPFSSMANIPSLIGNMVTKAVQKILTDEKQKEQRMKRGKK